jgi:3-phosphoshikimate 1-carboxyvinyltransferase
LSEPTRRHGPEDGAQDRPQDRCVPGDKSVAHRALLLAAIADGPSTIVGAPLNDDLTATLTCLEALGVRFDGALGDGALTVHPPARLRRPPRSLDCRGSATTARLLLGLLAAEGIDAVVDGDASLRRRPMERVAAPLRALFDRPVVATTDGTLPARVHGGAPPPERERAVVVRCGGSAQVKSALLLATRRGGAVDLRDMDGARDHTERLLAWLGVSPPPIPQPSPPGWRAGDTTASCIPLRGPWRVPGFTVRVPGDVSSAALLAVAPAILGRAFRCDDVLLNPTRLAFVQAFAALGVEVRCEAHDVRAGEPVGALHMEPRRSSCVGNATSGDRDIDIDARRALDEVPAIVALAVGIRRGGHRRGGGSVRLRGLAELRHKESDRLERCADLARAFGCSARVIDLDDGPALAVGPGLDAERPPECAAERCVHVRTDGDHRLAMAAIALGRALSIDVRLDAPGCEAKSFPGYRRCLDDALDAVIGRA